MRYSANSNDPGYSAWSEVMGRGLTIRVFLDGVEQDHCVTADDELGYVRRCKLDEDGMIYAVGDEVAEEDVSGEVRFEICA